MEEEQRRMQSAVFDVINDIDRKCLRTLHVNSYIIIFILFLNKPSIIKYLQIETYFKVKLYH